MGLAPQTPRRRSRGSPAPRRSGGVRPRDTHVQNALELPHSSMDLVPRQAAEIPFRQDGTEFSFCLVTTSDGGRWTFPKGIIEPGDTARDTALKEALEEAGLHGTLIGDPLGSFEQTKWGSTFSVQVYLMNVTAEDHTWDEAHLRQRRWCDREETLDLMQGRPVAPLFLESLRRLRGT